ncbi:MAG: hypothetical protein ACE5LV_08215 [Candidatus Aminicenantales bacterium]
MLGHDISAPEKRNQFSRGLLGLYVAKPVSFPVEDHNLVRASLVNHDFLTDKKVIFNSLEFPGALALAEMILQKSAVWIELQELALIQTEQMPVGRYLEVIWVFKIKPSLIIPNSQFFPE